VNAMKKLSLLFFVLAMGLTLQLAAPGALAEDSSVNEDDLFGGEDTVVSQDQVVKDDVEQDLKKTGLGVSGEVHASTTYTDYSDQKDWTGLGYLQPEWSNLVYSDVFFDLRMKEGMKAFLSLEGSYNFNPGKTIEIENGYPREVEADKADAVVKELFMDANIKNKVYFRVGKQVLEWGRSYFWNPTDLINIERKDFFDMDKSREGARGIKVHIPSGVKRNIYIYTGLEDVDKAEDASLAAKYEFLVGTTEMSFSGWTKRGYKPVFGYDFSGLLWGMTVRGELSLSHGDNRWYMEENDFTLYKKQGWVPRASLGFTKCFDNGDIANRISLTGELYYNNAGYDDNIFTKIANQPLERAIFAKAIYMQDVYEPYRNSRYYAAAFCSVRKFIVSDMTFNVNGILNLVDDSGILSTGVFYQPALKDWNLEFTVNTFLGGENTEATFTGDRYSFKLGMTYTF
jgi:hypothetical protein